MLGVSASELLADTETLASVLKYHVVPFEVTAAQLSEGQVLTTLLGAPLTVKKNDTGVYIIPTGGPTAKVITSDIKADNGVVHVIDAVLLPGAASPAAEYTMVEAAPSSE
jgi:transforming growth factor-beta-induced protein